MIAVSFDFGQTLAELDHAFVQKRLAERGASIDPRAARSATEAAWEAYGVHKPEGHALAWRKMIETLLRAGRVPEARVAELAEWLWHEQPQQNLWREPISGMIELVRELRAAKLPVAIISNSEGRLAELVDELGWSELFDLIVDSGKLGVDKPNAKIFDHACVALGVSPESLIHVGDSWAADIEGARAFGARAIWFASEHPARALPQGVLAASNAAEVRAALSAFGAFG